MPFYLRPGVYIEELADAYAPRGGRSGTVDPTTAVSLLREWSAPPSAVFVGITARGPVGTPQLASTWGQFEYVFGGHQDGLVLPLSVQAFFASGGVNCWIVRLPPEVRDAPGLVEAIGSLAGAVETMAPVAALAVPDVASWHRFEALGLEEMYAVQLAVIALGEMENLVAVLDAPQRSTGDVLTWRAEVAHFDSQNAVLAHPWLLVADQDADAGAVAIPPSGAVASLWSGSREPSRLLPGVEPVEVLTQVEAERLRSVGVIPISCTVDGSGHIADDARATSRPAKHWAGDAVVSSIFGAIERGTAWAVFHGSGPPLWARLATELGSFLDVLWRRGHLVGDAADAAYRVRCDETTNTAEDVWSRRVVTAVDFRAESGGRRHLRVVHQLQ